MDSSFSSWILRLSKQPCYFLDELKLYLKGVCEGKKTKKIDETIKELIKMGGFWNQPLIAPLLPQELRVSYFNDIKKRKERFQFIIDHYLTDLKEGREPTQLNQISAFSPESVRERISSQPFQPICYFRMLPSICPPFASFGWTFMTRICPR